MEGQEARADMGPHVLQTQEQKSGAHGDPQPFHTITQEILTIPARSCGHYCCPYSQTKTVSLIGAM
jgi:hypothetical protein